MKSIKNWAFLIAIALALTAFLGTASASAKLFHGEIAQTDLQGIRSGEPHRVTLPGVGFTLACSSANFSGKAPGVSYEPLVAQPTLSSCKYIGAETAFEMRGCSYAFHANGNFDIVGASCEAEPIRWWTAGCMILIGPQTGLKGVTYAKVGTGGNEEIVATANIKNITYQVSGFCGGSSGTKTDGEYQGTWNIKGKVSGSETFKLTRGELSETQKVALAGAQLACNKGILTGPSLAGSSELALTPNYRECQFLGSNTLYEMRGCKYVLHENGKFDIAGEKCAAEPMTFAVPGCTITIPPQSGLSAVSYSPGWSSEPSSMTVVPEVTGMTYTSKGFLCPKAGTFSDGTLKGKALLKTASYVPGTQVPVWIE